MIGVQSSFTFDHCGSDIVFGRGAIDRLDALLGDARSVLLVCGSNVGSNPAVMEPVEDALERKDVHVFDETTPGKLISTVYDGVEVLRTDDLDVIVGLGGGSSLDVARQISVFAADGRPLSSFRDAAQEGRAEHPNPKAPLTPVITVPTTLAGAGISSGGSIEVLPPVDSPRDHAIRVHGECTPEAILFDPNLFETTPREAIAGSAMNGFNKGLETLYARTSTPITDATAIRGTQLLRTSFPSLRSDPAAMDDAVVGTILSQFRRQTSIVHAFGHGFSYHYPVQQGTIHAILTPHVLRYVLDRVDARRRLVATGLGIDTERRSADEVATAIVDDIVAVRECLELPSRLRDVDPVDPEDFPTIAAFIRDDTPSDRVPPGLDPTAQDIEAVLREAW